MADPDTPLSYEAIKRGLPAAAVRALVGEGRLTRADIALVILRRTFERRLAEGQPLRVAEADAIARLLRVRDHARAVFEDDELADEWLATENSALGGRGAESRGLHAKSNVDRVLEFIVESGLFIIPSQAEGKNRACRFIGRGRP